jgi:hypothetical protein
MALWHQSLDHPKFKIPTDRERIRRVSLQVELLLHPTRPHPLEVPLKDKGYQKYFSLLINEIIRIILYMVSSADHNIKYWLLLTRDM